MDREAWWAIQLDYKESDMTEQLTQQRYNMSHMNVVL